MKIKTIKIVYAIILPMLFAGCSAVRVAPSRVPSFANVEASTSKIKADVSAAKRSSVDVAASADKAQQAVKKAQAAVTAKDYAMVTASLQEVTAQLALVQEHDKAAIDGLSLALLDEAGLEKENASLKGEVETQTKDLTTQRQQVANDQIVIKQDADTIKKLDKDVWIYKGGFCLIVIALGLSLLWHTELLQRLVAWVLLWEPWGWLVLVVGGPAVATGIFYTLFTRLP